MTKIRNVIISRNTLTCMLVFGFLLALVAVPDAYGEVYRVSGDVSGRWTSGDTYLVEGDIFVVADSALVIEPDVQVLFVGNHLFQVNGTLSAISGVEPGRTIEFAGVDGGDWAGIFFRSGGQDNSIVRDCIISNAWVGIDILGTSPIIFENTIHAQTVGINCENSRSDISDNTIVVGEGTSSQDLTGISLVNEANGLINDNHIRVNSNLFGELIGIRIEESRPTIQDNYIDVETVGEGYGIYSLTVTKLELVRNIIRTSSPNRITNAFFFNSTGVMLLNNTLHLMGNAESAWGLRIMENSEILIINNIVLGNRYSFGIHSDEGTVVESSGYNDVWRHNTNYIGGYQGNEQIDISEDPLIVNATPDAVSKDDYELLWYWDEANQEEVRSPCIDSGSPNWSDPDDTYSDIGAVYFDHLVSINDPYKFMKENTADNFELLNAYPNPFNSATHIKFYVSNSNHVNVSVLNNLGQSIEQLWGGHSGKGMHTLTWSPKYISSGSYFIRIENGGEIRFIKVSYLR